MQAGLHSWSFRNRFKEDPDFTVFQALDLTAEMGYASLEIMSGKANMPPGDFASDDLPYLKKVMRHAEQVGVRVHCLATYNDFAYVTDESWRLANIAYIKQWLGIAAELGVPNIRMLTGYSIADEPREKLERLTLEGIRECVPVAEKHGVNMAIENHNSIYFSADEILWLIDELGSDRLTTCPDPSNWSRDFFKGASAEQREQVFADTAKLAPKATDAHLKLKGVTDDGQLIGWGDDLDRVLRILRDGGYDGPVHFECIADGDLLAPLPEARKILQAAIDRVSRE